MAPESRETRRHAARWLRWLALCAAFLLAAPAGADTDVTEDILEILRESGDISEERYQELKKKARGEGEAGAEPDADADSDADGEDEAAAASKSGWDFGWDRNFKLKHTNEDGVVDYDLSFGGRIQNDWGGVDFSDGLGREVDGGEGFGTEIRRIRIFTKGTIHEIAYFKQSIDFADADVSIKDAYLGLKLGGLKVQVGHFKQPISLEFQNSSNNLVFVERSLANALAPTRDAGFMIIGNPFDQRMTWKAAFLVNADDDSGNFFDDDQNYDLSMRAAGLPIYEDDGERLLHVGASYRHGWRNTDVSDDEPDDAVEFDTEPEIHLSEDVLDTGDMLVDDLDTLGLELAGVFGPVHFQAEYHHTWLDRHGDADSGFSGKNVDFFGGYVQVGWYITGERRPYKKKDGYFGQTQPRNPLRLRGGGWGAFEVAARYSYLDLTDRDIRGGTLSNFTLAANWYPFSNFRVKANYVHGEKNGGGQVDGGVVRFQVTF